ncbi:hypothetical protein [Nocardiopsis algeriensis]|uniref:Rubrerythrin n=1 Tax=Nocardiopsis algeriensis TaxID=1478215 RepID=A0A841IRU2_9ACTN|nr:hypothetical protein [Nocardiopsis algeriensis]MBB6120964.1 rubrerythrin [Nocardiopsis algeriensis]
MATGQQATGVRDAHYDIVSVLYHVLQEADTAERYIRDAQEKGDTELAEFFTQIQKQDRERAERVKQLLKNRL